MDRGVNQNEVAGKLDVSSSTSREILEQDVDVCPERVKRAIRTQPSQRGAKTSTTPLPPRGCYCIKSYNDKCIMCVAKTPYTWEEISACICEFSFADRFIIITSNTTETLLNMPLHLIEKFPLQKSSSEDMQRRWNTHKRLTIFKRKFSTDVYLANDYCDDIIKTVIYNVIAHSVNIFALKFDSKRLEFKSVDSTRQTSDFNKNTDVRRTKVQKRKCICGHSVTNSKLSSGHTLTRVDDVLHSPAASKEFNSALSATTWKGIESRCFEVSAFPVTQGSSCNTDVDSSENTSLHTNFTQSYEHENQSVPRASLPLTANDNVPLSEDVNMEEANSSTQNSFIDQNFINYRQHTALNMLPVENAIASVQNITQGNGSFQTSENIGYIQNSTQILAYCKHPDYEDYNARLSTYVHWPSSCHQHPSVLSDSGLFYSGRIDCLICYLCGVELSSWSIDDDPLEKHVKLSPDCPFLEQKLGPDKLQFLRDRVSHRIQYCSEASTTVQSDFVSYEGHSVDTSERRNYAQTEIHPADFARSPQYAEYNVRLSTFKNWPVDLPQRPPQLADAGFYYTGFRDVVRCYVCDGGLQKWDPNDDPWIEHARWFSTCPYVLHVKGQDFVNLVISSAEESDEEIEGLYATAQNGRNQMQTNNVSLTRDASIAKSKSSCTDKRLDTAAVESVLCMGYSRKAVLIVLDILCEKGQQDPRADAILEILLEKEDAGEELPRDSSSPPPKEIPFEDMYKTDYEPPSDPKALLNENQILVEKIKCLDCQERNKNVLFLPCTHHELCEVCAADVIVCPKCWREVKQKVKTFMC